MPRLTAKRIERLLQQGRPGRYADQGGLHLRIAPGGSTQWLVRASVDGRRVERGLGGFPTISLDEARTRAKEAVVALRREGVSQAKRTTTPTLRAVTMQALNVFKQEWRRDEGDWLQSMERHVLGELGDWPVDAIGQDDVLRVLDALADKPHTQRLIRGRLRRVLAYAQARQLRRDNPAGESISAALRRKLPAHRHYAPPTDLANSFARFRASFANPATILAFEFVAHSAARWNEVRGLEWGELDGDWRIWTIPAWRSKDGREHRKPVTRQMRHILATARALQDVRGRKELVFGIAPSTLRSLKRDLGLDHTIHGLRSSFKAWTLENNEAWHLAELQLSHALGSAVAMAYISTDLLEERRALAQRWSDFVDPGDYWESGLEKLIAMPCGGVVQ